MTRFHIVSLFPRSFDSYLNASIIKRAQERKLIAIKHYNPRDFVVPSKKGTKASYADRRIDNRPYGGGPGMVIEALPVIHAIAAALKSASNAKGRKQKAKGKVKVIFFSPAGKQFSNEAAETFKKYTDIVLVCGRYEGVDARVKRIFPMADISIGPYVLTGGELPAMIIIDSVTRRIPGVLGHDSSLEETRVASSDVYTRPESFKYTGKTYRVPKILLSGHHAKMDEWKIRRTSRSKAKR